MSFSTTGSVFSKRAPRKQTLSVLICGASGTGKSSFINTLVGRRVLFDSENLPGPTQPQNVRFTTTVAELDEPLSDGSKLVLSLIETEGLGVQLNHLANVEQVAEFIEHRFDEVLAEESRIRRNPRFKDNRIDVCLYFIEPTGHGLRELDVLTLKRLSSIINVIPVLARSDTLTPAECVTNKRLVLEDLRFNDIDVFDFHFSDEQGSAQHASEGQTEATDNEFNSAVPFAVTSSSEFGEDGNSLNLRSLPFGTVEVLNPQHCDVSLLKEALLDGFLMELKDRTHDVLYETFRTHRLDPQQNHRASLLMPQELADHAARLKQAQIDRETALLREEERRVNAEIEAKRALLLRRERELKELEIKMSESRVPSYQTSQPTSTTSTHFPEDQLPPQPASTAVNTHANNPFASATTATPIKTTVATPASASAHATAPPPPAQPEIHGAVQGTPESRRFSTDSAYADASQDGPGMSTSAADSIGYVDGPVTEETLDSATASQLRVRQVRSKKELREHASQLHAELGNLEAQKKDIQRQVASAASSRSLHAHLADPSSINFSDLSEAAPELPAGGNNTSPLNIKKAGPA